MLSKALFSDNIVIHAVRSTLLIMTVKIMAEAKDILRPNAVSFFNAQYWKINALLSYNIFYPIAIIKRRIKPIGTKRLT